MGNECDGGFYAGKYELNGIDYALIVSPKEQGETIIDWKSADTWESAYTETAGTLSESDGLANTLAMLRADGAMQALDAHKQE